MLRIRVGGVLAITALLMLTGCRTSGEVHEESFGDLAEAVASGTVDQRSVPTNLPGSASEARLIRNTASNESIVAFTYSQRDHSALVEPCNASARVPTATLQVDWLPPGIETEGENKFICDNGYLVTDAGFAYYWSLDTGLSVNDLANDPERYTYLDGHQATVVGWIDFGNIFDRRETYYGYEAIGFVKKPSQFAQPIVFAVFPDGSDPHPLFDEIDSANPSDDAAGVQLIVSGTISVTEQHTNISMSLGYDIEVSDPADATVVAPGTDLPVG